MRRSKQIAIAVGVIIINIAFTALLVTIGLWALNHFWYQTEILSLAAGHVTGITILITVIRALKKELVKVNFGDEGEVNEKR